MDWIALLDSKGIAWGRQNKTDIHIACPFCGDDPSFHLGISLTTGNFYCWRNVEHRGRKPHRLLMRLLGISYQEAAALVGGTLLEDDWEETLRDGLQDSSPLSPKPSSIINPLTLPESFLPIVDYGVRKKFYTYLTSRKFDDVATLCDTYSLKCCLVGEYNHRVIFPIYFGGQLVSYTGRTLYKNAMVRYLTLGTDQSPVPASRWLYNYDRVKNGGKWLVIVEGPIDCLKADFYGEPFGIRAVALLGTALTDARVELIVGLADRVDRVGLCLDRTAAFNAIGYLAGPLARLRLGTKVKFLNPPDGCDDLGEATPAVLKSWMQKFCNDTSSSFESPPD